MRNGQREQGGKHEGGITESKARQSFKERTVDNDKYTYTYHYLNKLMVGYTTLRDSKIQCYL